MFKKIIIAEDHEVRNLGVINTLKELKIPTFEFVNYCDDAVHKIKNSISDNNPYDLLITDLSFDEDYKNQEIKNGQELIKEVRKMLPNLKIIVFSIEKKPKIIDDLFKIYQIDGFVSKGRNDGKELKNTLKKVFANKKVLPQEIINSIRNHATEFNSYDVLLLESLAKGLRQQEIEEYFKEKNIKPNSQSSIEKRLNELRESLNAKTNVEMVVLCKDLGII
ncbi:DNA-binding response regulator [Cloacibacterium sp.]|uniref:DNA-binding response regulator n=1 Tax=Cloacibacterium sp. TaxID=1913682 RepID=UPI0039E6F34A